MTTHRIHSALAAGASLTLGVSVAVAIGGIPHGSSPTVLADRPAAVAAAVIHDAAPGAVHASAGRGRHLLARTGHAHGSPVASHSTTKRSHSSTASGASAASHTATHTVTGPASTPSPSGTTTHRTHHAAATTTSPTHSSHSTKPTHPSKPAKPAKAPRTQPSASAVAQALSGLKSYVHTILSPTAGQVAEFGDMVCSAFDNGQTYSQIKTTILQKVSSLPLTTVLPGAADFVVRTAVSLYCPGYHSKLG